MDISERNARIDRYTAADHDFPNRSGKIFACHCRLLKDHRNEGSLVDGCEAYRSLEGLPDSQL